jgi:hypothetical protein
MMTFVLLKRGKDAGVLCEGAGLGEKMRRAALVSLCILTAGALLSPALSASVHLFADHEKNEHRLYPSQASIQFPSM